MEKKGICNCISVQEILAGDENGAKAEIAPAITEKESEETSISTSEPRIIRLKVWGPSEENRTQSTNSGSQNNEAVSLVQDQLYQPIRFILGLTPTRDWSWTGFLWADRLYLEVPPDVLERGSRDGFITLMEYAEEVLHCSSVILILSKDQHNRPEVTRSFMFLGFFLLTPGHPHIPSNSSSSNIFLTCSLK